MSSSPIKQRETYSTISALKIGSSTLPACALVPICQQPASSSFTTVDHVLIKISVPLEVFVCREVLEETFYKSKPFSKLRHVIITSAVIFIAMGLALTTCDLGVVLELAGGLSASALAFILPASAYFVMLSGPWSSRRRLPALLVAGFGMIVLVLSCGLSLKKAWSGEGGKSEC